MRIKLDENLPARLVPVLTELGHDDDTVLEEHLAGCDDDVVWQAAQANRCFLITQVSTFPTFESTCPAHINGLLLVRLPQPGRTALFERISDLFRTEDSTAAALAPRAMRTPISCVRATTD